MIKIAGWKVALDIEASQAIQSDIKATAYGCSCSGCEAWKKILGDYASGHLNSECAIEPLKEILGQLSRALILLDHPADIYKLMSTGRHDLIRVQYFFVGRVIEGSDTILSDVSESNVSSLSPCQAGLKSVTVSKDINRFNYYPNDEQLPDGDLLQVDLLVWVNSINYQCEHECQ